MSRLWDEIVDGEPEDERLWEIYHENSKTSRVSGIPDDNAVAAHMLELWEELPYPGADAIELPAPSPLAMPLAEAIRTRRTQIAFGSEPLALGDLSALLRAGYGVSPRPSAVGERSFRTVPSAGALYPLELYVHAGAVAGLEPGLYHFRAKNAQLQRLRTLHPPQLAAAFVQSDVVETAAAVLVVTAAFLRTTFKYGERGYRFALIEAGHVAQNVDLAAAALSLPAANLGGFFDRELEALLELDGVESSVLYAIAVGSRTIR